MKIAPLSMNQAASATVTSSAGHYERGHPAANAFTADPRQKVVFRNGYLVELGVNDTIKFNDGSARTATLTAGLYNSSAEFAIHVAARMNAVSSAWQARMLQGSVNRYRWILSRTAGTASLTAAGSTALELLLGFRAQDRSAAASHTGDFAAAGSGYIDIDLGAAKSADATFVAGLEASAGASVYVAGLGGGFAFAYAPDSVDPECTSVFYGTEATYERYWRLLVVDPQRDSPTRLALGYWYHGPYFDTAASGEFGLGDWEVQTYGRSLETQYARHDGVTGHAHLSERPAKPTMTVAFAGSPGLHPSQSVGMERLIRALGINGLAFVALDSVGEPGRETRLCRLTQPPAFERMASESRDGRWRVALSFEQVAV